MEKSQGPLRPDDIPQEKWVQFIKDSTYNNQLDTDFLSKFVWDYRSEQAKKEKKKQEEWKLKDKKAGLTNQGPVAKPAERDPKDDWTVYGGTSTEIRKRLLAMLDKITPELIDCDTWHASLGMNNKLHDQGTSQLGGYGLALQYTTDKKYRVAIGYVEKMRAGEAITAARFINGQPTGKQCLDALRDNIEKDGK